MTRSFFASKLVAHLLAQMSCMLLIYTYTLTKSSWIGWKSKQKRREKCPIACHGGGPEASRGFLGKKVCWLLQGTILIWTSSPSSEFFVDPKKIIFFKILGKQTELYKTFFSCNITNEIQFKRAPRLLLFHRRRSRDNNTIFCY